MMAAAGLALRQLDRLDVNPRPISQLDDLLLFACLPSFFVYGISSLVPAMAYSNYMALFVSILQVFIYSLTEQQFNSFNFQLFLSLNFEGGAGDSADASHHRRSETVQSQ